MFTLLIAISIIAYLTGAVIVSQRMTGPSTMQRRSMAISAIALITHFAILGYQFTSNGLVHLNLFTTLAMITWLLAFFNTLRGDHPASLLLRPAIFSLAAVSIIAVFLVPDHVGRPVDMTPVFALHISLALLASALLTLATLYGVQLLYLNKLLKKRSAKALSDRLPPLMSVERYFFHLLTAGTILLTLAIIVGFIYLDNWFARGQLHKTILSLLAWVSFGSILIVHYWRGLRGRLAVYYTLIASALLILSYFGSRFVRDILL
ncbi:cytochrome C assembly family protein [Aliidiomarina sanyensis]|uniref:ABC transporter permease n=1 Tax=Aliidiomarina sanyensis TaxID=1249555 RepID=A0A432WNC9_9GAMM|nr:cytochrome c biogenesis protein CcsA [Aliidiomarina sanyensis]RUO35284.1 ABC transporter permease [Aliidiomarina sanyensis]